jgi:hypothetical protein
LYLLYGREDLRPVVDVELLYLLGGDWPLLPLLWYRQHRCDQSTRARARDQVEVVSYPGIWPVQLLKVTEIKLIIHPARPAGQYLKTVFGLK